MMKMIRAGRHAIEKMGPDDSASMSLCWLLWHGKTLNSLARRRVVAERWRSHGADVSLYVSHAAMAQSVWPAQNAVDLAVTDGFDADACIRWESGWPHDGWVTPNPTDRRWTTFNFDPPPGQFGPKRGNGKSKLADSLIVKIFGHDFVAPRREGSGS